MTGQQEEAGKILSLISHSILSPEVKREKLRQTYDEWANTYEQDIALVYPANENRKFKICKTVDELFNNNRAIQILDVGAGTGMSGQMLYDVGYRNLDALEPSSKMLEQAEKRNIYKKRICNFIGSNKLDISNDTYDMVFGVGVLLFNHINEEAFEEMIRITKPGGYIVQVVSANSFAPGKKQIEASMQKLHNEGKWKWIETRTIERYKFTSLENAVGGESGLLFIFNVV